MAIRVINFNIGEAIRDARFTQKPLLVDKHDRAYYYTPSAASTPRITAVTLERVIEGVEFTIYCDKTLQQQKKRGNTKTQWKKNS